jgi:hypothetical protein
MKWDVRAIPRELHALVALRGASGRTRKGQKRACEPYVDAPEAPRRATRACDLQGIARTSHFLGTCFREVCGGSSDDDFGGPMTPPHGIREGLRPSLKPCQGHEHWQIAVRCVLASCDVSLIEPRTPQEAQVEAQQHLHRSKVKPHLLIRKLLGHKRRGPEAVGQERQGSGPQTSRLPVPHLGQDDASRVLVKGGRRMWR